MNVKISYSIYPKDNEHFAQEVFQKKSGIERILLKAILYLISYVPIIIVGMDIIKSMDDQIIQFGEFWPTFYIAIPLFLIRFWIVPYFDRKSYERSGLEGKIHTVELLPELVVASSGGFETKIKWAEFKYLTRRTDYAVLWITGQNGLIIPYRAFDSEDDKSAFLDFVSTKIIAVR